jgi:NADPH2:quinone reductase
LSGIVYAVGEGVKHIKTGDKVIAFIGQGAFAQQVLAPANAVIPMPEGMDFDTAAAITLTYGTSHHAVVDRAQLKAGETMLVLGAAGGVGLAAIEIGKAIGAKVIAAASTDENSTSAANMAPI